MVAAKSSRVNRQYKKKYRIRNWREYERGLRSRGDVTIWLSEDAIAAWVPPKNGLRGGQRRYSNLAIRTALTLRAVAARLHRCKSPETAKSLPSRRRDNWPRDDRGRPRMVQEHDAGVVLRHLVYAT